MFVFTVGIYLDLLGTWTLCAHYLDLWGSKRRKEKGKGKSERKEGVLEGEKRKEELLGEERSWRREH